MKTLKEKIMHLLGIKTLDEKIDEQVQLRLDFEDMRMEQLEDQASRWGEPALENHDGNPMISGVKS